MRLSRLQRCDALLVFHVCCHVSRARVCVGGTLFELLSLVAECFFIRFYVMIDRKRWNLSVASSSHIFLVLVLD